MVAIVDSASPVDQAGAVGCNVQRMGGGDAGLCDCDAPYALAARGRGGPAPLQAGGASGWQDLGDYDVDTPRYLYFWPSGCPRLPIACFVLLMFGADEVVVGPDVGAPNGKEGGGVVAHC